jgi:hypothetical protein
MFLSFEFRDNSIIYLIFYQTQCWIEASDKYRKYFNLLQKCINNRLYRLYTHVANKESSVHKQIPELSSKNLQQKAKL